ncbi:hypothetical protein CBS101457_000843 [Exobasidium rhododendri]|nr:hypothetical protein CBS101457_000843 [Exobasidium rhododendri]
MKSWSLGRKSTRKDKRKETATLIPRPQSMVLTFPTSSSNAEISSSARPSAPIVASANNPTTVNTGENKSVTSSSSASPNSAFRYLNTTRLKDKVRREKRTSTTSISDTSRAPLTSPNHVKEIRTDSIPSSPEARSRTISVPSLIKSPGGHSPIPSTAILSPTAAIARSSNSHTAVHDHQGHSDVLSSSPSYLDSASHHSSDSLAMSPTPSRTAIQSRSVLSTPQSPTRPTTRLDDITSELPRRRTSSGEHSPKNSKHRIGPQKMEGIIVIKEGSEVKETGQKGIDREDEERVEVMKDDKETQSNDQENGEHMTNGTKEHHTISAVESLRKFKGVEGHGLADRKRLEAADSLPFKEGSVTEGNANISQANTTGEEGGKTGEDRTINKARTLEKTGNVEEERTLQKTDDIKEDQPLESVGKVTEAGGVGHIRNIEKGSKKEDALESESPDDARKDTKQPEGEWLDLIDEAEQAKYTFAIRKKQPKKQKPTQSTKRKARAIEGRYEFAIVAQSARNFSFGTGVNKGAGSRLFVAMPVPSLLGCDRAAGWTVERISRLTSCIINVFGS